MSFRKFIIKVKREEDPIFSDLMKYNIQNVYDFLNVVIDLNILNKSRVKYNLRRGRIIKERIDKLKERDCIIIDELLDNIDEIRNLENLFLFHQKNYCRYLKKMKDSYEIFNKINIFYKKYIYGNSDDSKEYYLNKLKNIVYSFCDDKENINVMNKVF